MKYQFFLGCLFFAHLYSQNNNNIPLTVSLETIKERAQKSVSLGLETVHKEITQNIFFPFPEQCLGQAIMQDKKDVVEYLCSLKDLDIDYEMEFPHPALSQLPGNITFREMPLLAGAIVYINENDLFIMDCLLKRGAKIREFNVQQNKTLIPLDPMRLAAALQKEKIVGQIVSFKMKETFEKQWLPTSSTGTNGPLDMSDDFEYFNQKININNNNSNP